MQENGTDQPKVYRRTRTMLKIRCTNVRETRHSYSQSTESEKAEFHTPAIPNETRNYIEHNSAENTSQDLVHLTKSDIEASASLVLNQKKGRKSQKLQCTCIYTCTYTCTCTGESRGTVPHSRIQKVNEKELWKTSQFIWWFLHVNDHKDTKTSGLMDYQFEKLNFELYILYSRAE